MRFGNITSLNYIKITMYGGMRLLAKFLDFWFLMAENAENSNKKIFDYNLPNGIYWQVAGKVM